MFYVCNAVTFSDPKNITLKPKPFQGLPLSVRTQIFTFSLLTVNIRVQSVPPSVISALAGKLCAF